MIGLDGAGKTTILNKFQFEETRQIVTTFGLYVEAIKHSNIEMMVFDVAGDDRSLWTQYLHNVDVLIWVIDSTDKERMPIIREEMAKITKLMKGQSYLLALFFNKQDAENKMSNHEILQKIGLDDLEVGDVLVQKCTASTGEGLGDGLDKIVEYLSQQKIVKSNSICSKGQTKKKGNSFTLTT